MKGPTKENWIDWKILLNKPPSQSDGACRWLQQHNRNRIIRLCIESKPMNQVFYTNIYPLLDIDDLLTDLSTAKLCYIPQVEHSIQFMPFTTLWAAFKYDLRSFLWIPNTGFIFMENGWLGFQEILSIIDHILRVHKSGDTVEDKNEKRKKEKVSEKKTRENLAIVSWKIFRSYHEVTFSVHLWADNRKIKSIS